MNRLLIRNILAILLYTGFFTVQLKASFLIQENIKFRNDYNCLKKAKHSAHQTAFFVKANKNISNHKKSNMNRRFIPEDIKLLHIYNNAEHFTFNATPTKAALKNRLLSISRYLFEDRGPPAIA